MEDLDQTILALLAEDGRMSYTDIGKRTGLSTSAAQQRVRRLEQRGVITGYRAVVDHAALGAVLTAFVEVTPLDPRQPDDVAERLEDVPEVVSCFSVAGQANYLLRVVVHTTAELEEVLNRLRNREGLSTQTTIVLSTPFEDRPWPATLRSADAPGW